MIALLAGLGLLVAGVVVARNPRRHPPMRGVVIYPRLLGLAVVLAWVAVLLIGPALWATMAPVDCNRYVCEVR